MLQFCILSNMAEIVSIKKTETKLQHIDVHILTFCERDVIQAKCKVESHFIDPFSKEVCYKTVSVKLRFEGW